MSIFSAVAALLSTVAFQPFASGFNAPLDVAAPRSEPGVVYVVEQGGEIWRLRNGVRDTTPFLDVRSSISAGGERGLLSVAFDPNYAKNRFFYVDYTDTNGDTRVVRYRSDGDHALPGTATQLLFVKQPYPNHNGGQLQFGPDGYLYVGMGDGGSGGDPQNRSQNLKSRLGKLLRYKAGRWQIAAYGLRNPWRFSFDRATGALWIGDVGQNEWEEVDTVKRGFGLTNFGWRVWEGRSRYTPDQTPNPAGQARLPGLGLPPRRRRLLDHGGLRVPGSRGARDARPVRVRRLLLGEGLELLRRQGDADRVGSGAHVVRRGLRGRALRRRRRAAASSSSPPPDHGPVIPCVAKHEAWSS